MNEEFESLLIVLVREHAELYNPNHPGYRDKDNYPKSWKEIAKALRSDPETCYLRWKSLRATYRKITIKIQAEGGLESYKKKWKYFDEMSFINKYLSSSKPLANIYGESNLLDKRLQASFHTKLISAVHENELIYNPDHQFYHQAAKSKAVWNQLAEEIDSEPQKCRIHWSFLRSYYRKLKKKKYEKGGLTNYQVRWQHYDAMSFIDKYDDTKTHAAYSQDNSSDDFSDVMPMYEEMMQDVSSDKNKEEVELSEADSVISVSNSACNSSGNNKGQQKANERTCSHFFALLGAKIDEIECPPSVRYNLEKNITDLVYDLLETCSNISD